jgi:hypothetical protein
MTRTLLLGLLGIVLAVAVGFGVHLVTRETISLPVAKLEQAPTLAPPAAREQPPDTTTTATETTETETTETETTDTTSATTGEDSDGSGRGRGRGRGRGGNSGPGGGGSDD